jgi:hypothetical protein
MDVVSTLSNITNMVMVMVLSLRQSIFRLFPSQADGITISHFHLQINLLSIRNLIIWIYPFHKHHSCFYAIIGNYQDKKSILHLNLYNTLYYIQYFVFDLCKSRNSYYIDSMVHLWPIHALYLNHISDTISDIPNPLIDIKEVGYFKKTFTLNTTISSLSSL